jgi:hypothetical protein
MPLFPTYSGELPSVLNPFNPRHHFLLAYWILFRPTALKRYLYQSDPECYVNKAGNFRTLFNRPTYRGLYLTALLFLVLIIIFICLPMNLGTNLLIIYFNPGICEVGHLWGASIDQPLCQINQQILDNPFLLISWRNWLTNIAGVIFMGTVIGTMPNLSILGSSGRIATGIAGLIAFSFGYIFTGGIAFNIIRVVVGGITGGIVLGIVVSEDIGYSVILSIGISIIVGGIEFANRELWLGIIFTMALSFGVLRLPMYILQYLWITVFGCGNHPIAWDEYLILPLPKSIDFLLKNLEEDEAKGVILLAQQMDKDFQRWAAQKALYLFLHSDKNESPLSFFYNRLQQVSLHEYVSFPKNSFDYIDLVTNGEVLILELALIPPDKKKNIKDSYSKWIYDITRPLRITIATPITEFAWLFYKLTYVSKESLLSYKLLRHSASESESFFNLFACNKNLNNYPYGYEIMKVLETIKVFFDCKSLADLALMPLSLQWITEASNHPNPFVIDAIKTLGETGIEASIYQASSGLLNKITALTRANENLQQLNQFINDSFLDFTEVSSIQPLMQFIAPTPTFPEAILLQLIITQWQKLIVVTAGREGHIADLKPVANPYVVGNPVTGQLFVGRDDIMRRFEELWNAPGQLPSIVLYGHRRMGKTSILRNLPDRFGHDQIIDFNMQRVGYVESTGELFYNLALAIYDTLPPNTISEPSKNEYLQENPFTAFDRGFLKKLHPRPNNQRLIIAIDEFEIIEDLIKTGKIEVKFLDFFRSLIQTYPWFILVFAGLHTLQEMTQDYWGPLFGNTSLIPVSFLNPKAAAQLITNPSPDFSIDYDQEAIELIYTLTNGQPYLVQLICHNLITYYNNQRFEDNLDRPARFTTQDVEAIIAVPEFYRDGNAYFTGVWEQSKETHGQDQIQILQTLCTKSLDLDQLAVATNQNPEQLQAALNTLIDHDVIYLQEHQYIYKVELMRRWVATQKF